MDPYDHKVDIYQKLILEDDHDHGHHNDFQDTERSGNQTWLNSESKSKVELW